MQKLPTVERRRSQRLALQVPVFVYGRYADNRPFHEAARMVSLNAYGGLLALNAPLRPGQTILLVNRTTQEELACNVISISAAPGKLRHAGIEFVRPTPDFWRVPFPPAES